jgi:hypothetical protein
VYFNAVQGGTLLQCRQPELALFGTNIRQARMAAATAIEALPNGVPVAKRDPLAAGMTENIERMIRILSGRPELIDWLDRLVGMTMRRPSVFISRWRRLAVQKCRVKRWSQAGRGSSTAGFQLIGAELAFKQTL